MRAAASSRSCRATVLSRIRSGACKVVDFREESEAAFAEVPATLRETLLTKLLSGELATRALTSTI